MSFKTKFPAICCVFLTKIQLDPKADVISSLLNNLKWGKNQ